MDTVVAWGLEGWGAAAVKANIVSGKGLASFRTEGGT